MWGRCLRRPYVWSNGPRVQLSALSSQLSALSSQLSALRFQVSGFLTAFWPQPFTTVGSGCLLKIAGRRLGLRGIHVRVIVDDDLRGRGQVGFDPPDYFLRERFPAVATEVRLVRERRVH